MNLPSCGAGVLLRHCERSEAIQRHEDCFGGELLSG
jgi:hypothetical protein